MLVFLNERKKVFDRCDFGVGLVAGPLEVSSLPENLPIPLAFVVGRPFATECSSTLLSSCQWRRTSNISTLCPLIRNARSSSARICSGGRRLSMNWATNFSHLFVSNSLSVNAASVSYFAVIAFRSASGAAIRRRLSIPSPVPST